MQQQDEGADMSQQNAQSDVQEHATDEISGTSETVLQEAHENNDPVLEASVTEDKSEIGDIEKSSIDTISDSPPTRSKTTKHSSKRANSKQKRDEVEICENQPPSEVRNGNGLTETEHTEETSVLTIEETEVVEDDTPEVAPPVCGETNGIGDLTEEPEHEECTEYNIEDEKRETSQEVIEEEVSVAASVSYKEITRSVGAPSAGTEKYSLSISSSEIHQFKCNPKDDKRAESPFSSENSYVSGSSWGGNIRSISARRPVRKHPLPVSDRSSVSSDRQGNIRLSTDVTHSDTDCSVDTTEGSIFASLKRKAVESEDTSLKKRKVNDSKNSTFFSMVSSPLRLFRNKLSDRIMEGHSVLNTDVSLDRNDIDDESINDKIKKESNDVKETNQYVLAEEVSNQNGSVYRSWCSIM